MDGVGHGTELAERYRLEERLLTTRTWQFWRAVDTILERSVGVMLLDPSTADEATDAARRAALVEDPRLLRVLDAGTEQVHQHTVTHPVTYVVCEYVDGVSLETLLVQGGTLGADTVRTMVGEAAQALAHAAENGLHHGRLRPSSVLRTPDGSVKVAGLAVEAAAEGDAGPADPARADALALVGLVYAGLTGRWPLTTEVPGGTGLEPAPMVSGAPVPPGDLVSGVPNDLDTLCAVTFGPHDDGPRSPAEVAQELRPWRGQTELLTAAVADGTAGRGPAQPAPARTRTDRTMRPPSRFPVRLAAGAASIGAAAASAEAATAGGAGTGALAETTDDATLGTGRGHGGPTQRIDAFVDHGAGDDAERASGSAASAAAVSAATGGADPLGEPDPFGQYGAYDTDDGLDAYDDSPRRDPRVLLAVVAAAVALVVALWLALGALTGPDEEPRADETTTPAGEETSAPATASPTETTPTDTPIQIAGIEALDPEGDGSENDETVAGAIDGDPSTSWRSETYGSAAFGGLKDGLGVAVSLSGTSSVSGVTLLVNGTGGSVELRTASGPAFEGSTVVASADKGTGPIELDLDEPVDAQHLVLWFTELPDVGGEFRVELAEVTVR